jgi:hypothetical protein
VVSTTVWHVAGSPRGVDLYRRLGPAVTRSGNGEAPPGAVWIADSKVVYRAGQGLAALERGVHAALGACLELPRGWHDLWPALTGQPSPTAATDPCCAEFDCELPLALAAGESQQAASALDAAMHKARVRLHAIRSRAVFPREFNALVAQHGGKGEALSRVTTDLVAEALDNLGGSSTALANSLWRASRRQPDVQQAQAADGCTAEAACADEPAWIICDKHGGRNRYGPLLQQRFPETLIEARGESRARSTYRWRHGSRPVEADFCAGGEQHLPVALASMISKYLREAAMLAFNRFWGQRLPDLRPTAGYPTDAHRFRRQIKGPQRELGMEDGVLWRVR